MQVTVIGAGIVGLSAAWQLVRRGHEVVVLDQGPIPDPESASFDQHRMIRPQYGPQADYTRMLRDALATWDEMWSDLGAVHFAATGVLAINLGDTGWMRQTVCSLREETMSAFRQACTRGVCGSSMLASCFRALRCRLWRSQSQPGSGVTASSRSPTRSISAAIPQSTVRASIVSLSRFSAPMR